MKMQKPPQPLLVGVHRKLGVVAGRAGGIAVGIVAQLQLLHVALNQSGWMATDGDGELGRVS